MTKHFLLGISILPALLVMPAMAIDVANLDELMVALQTGGNINLTDDIVINGGMPVVANTVIDGGNHGVTPMTFAVPSKIGSVNAYQGTLGQGTITGIDDVFYYANSTLAVGNKIYSDSGKTDEVGTITFKSGTIYSVGQATTATLTRDPSQDVFASNKTYLAFTTSSNETVYAYISGANKTEADLTASTLFYSTAATTNPVGMQGATLVEDGVFSTNQYDTFDFSVTGKPHDIYEINGDTVYYDYNKTPTCYYSSPALASDTKAYIVSGSSVQSFKNNLNVAAGTDLTVQNMEFNGIQNSTSLEKGGAVYSDNSASETKNNITLDNVNIHDNVAGSGIVYTENSNLIASDIEATNNTGGVFYVSGSDANISGNFVGNHTTSGGAIYATSGSNLTVAGLFQENYANTSVANAAGAINSAQGALTILDGTQFKNNYSKKAGAGAVNVSGLSTTPGKGGYLTVGNNVVFDGNSAGYESFDSNVVTKATANGGAMVIGALMESPTFGTGVKFKNNRAANQGGALALTGAAADDAGMIFNNGIEFDNNSASQGGAFAITANIKTTLDGLSFTNNHANGGDNAIGGALVVSGSVTNQTTPENAASKVKTLTITNTSFEDNQSDTAAGAIGQTMITAFNGSKYSQGMTINVLNSTFTDNTAGAEGGAIVSDAILNVTGSTFEGNNTTGTAIGTNYVDSNEGGGAIFMYDDSVATITNSTFTSNESGTWGGAISTRGISSAQPGANSSLTVNGGTFTDNSAVYGGAIANSLQNTVNDQEEITKYGAVVSGATFKENSATQFGGAIYNVGDITVNNTVFGGVDSTDPQNPVSLGNSANKGGAIYNAGTISLTGGSFVGNTAVASGGAIENKDVNSALTLTNVNFTNNSADWAGAVEVRGTVNITGGSFTGNTSNDGGGAIYLATLENKGHKLTIDGTTFTNNGTVGTDVDGGGAIGSFSDLVLRNATFTGNYFGVENVNTTADGGGAIMMGSVSTNLIENTTFTDNTSKLWGGAISMRDVNKGNNDDATLDMNNVTFTHNTAVYGGAIYNTFHNDANDDGYVSVNGATFNNNIATNNGGAIYNSAAGTTDTVGGVMQLNNSTFTGNTAGGNGGALYNEGELTFDGSTRFTTNTAALQGGALFNSDSGEVLFKKLATFTGNQATGTATTEGGAINNAGTVTFEKNAVFTNNQADAGGAIVNNGGTLTLTEASVFQSNHANLVGGALLNNSGTVSLTDATFRNNSATAAGGAIANDSGTITLNGTNTFIGNTANGHANDIDSHGTLNIASGTTTLSGGITGGPSATLNIAEGATLNIGTASVAQNTINLNGTMLATLRGGDNAQITASTAFNGDGELKLAFDGEGLYHVFGGEVFAKENGIDLSSVVYDLTWSADGKDVTASLKSVEDLAEENHLTTETAATIVNLTSSTSDVLNDLSVTIQEKLATGTEEARQEVEQAQVAINPEKESVVQSVTSSVQNAVSSLAMSRMSMPMNGRNGGDAKMTGRGVWVNGIFNKAKQNDAFNGYTRGFAAGLDGTINNKWTIGAGYSFAHSDVDGSARDTEIESSSVFVYGQYRQKAWYVNGVANYTMADYSEQGTALGTPVTADYDVKSYGANVATGYRFAGGITPELSLRYLHIDGSDYVNSLGIKNELKESDYLTAALGTKYAFRIKVTEAFRLRPELSYAVKYDMLSDKQVANVTMPGLNSYALDGDRLSRIAGEFGIGLGARYKGLDVSLNYDIEAREDYTSQTGRLKFRYNF